MPTREELIQKYGAPTSTNGIGQLPQPSRAERWKSIDEQEIKKTADRIQAKKEAAVAGRPWWQKALDIATPGAQFREAEKGETPLGDIAGGIKGAVKGIGSTLVGA